jgi:phospholipid/cholesterol/gamma-HCH transport system permease protein
MPKWRISRTGERLEIAGELRIGDGAAIWKRMRELAQPPAPRLDLDLHDAGLIDGAVMALVVDLRRSLAARGTRSELVNVPPRILPLVHLYRGDVPAEVVIGPAPAQGSPIAWLGAAVLRQLDRIRSLVVFGGQLIGAMLADVRRLNWRALPGLIERAGTDGIPIVFVANFLIGLVMGYQTMEQLKLYGANVYVADVVGLSVTRELSPLMTGILVIGRSGAAYAAEIGAMRVSEEIDALRTMGFSPVSYLVAPRTIALAICAPLLTLLGDIAGIFGGLAVAVSSLHVTPHAYVVELRSTLVHSDVWTGLVKSVAFGVAIAFISCRQGLSARGAASGVGRSTTSTVVIATFVIIVVDSVFTVVFRSFGL